MENFPAGQLSHSACALLPIFAEYDPALQFWQTSLVAARLMENFPVAHKVHGAAPVAALNVPAIHPVHVPPLGPVYPELQVQAVIPVLFKGEFEFELQLVQVDSAICADSPEYLPVAQEVHGAAPIGILYVPARHAVQVSLPSGPVKPGLHLQSVFTLFPALTATVFVGHAWQALSAVLPVNVLYLPDAHRAQVSLPDKILYVPVTHTVQVSLPSGPVKPGLHLQSVFTLFPVLTATVFVGHAWQSLSAVFPVNVLYLPVAQTLHCAWSVSSL